MNKHQINLATEAGRTARRAGKRLSDNPFRHGNTRDVQVQRDAWDEGWHEQDAELARQQRELTAAIRR